MLTSNSEEKGFDWNPLDPIQLAERSGLPNLYNGKYLLNISGLYDNCTATILASTGLMKQFCCETILS